MIKALPKCRYNVKGCADCDFSMKTVFRALTREQRTRLEDNVVQLDIPRKQVIFSQGATPQYVYFIHSGMVKITLLGENGKEQIIRMGKAGDLIGYRSMLAGEKYHASAIAMSPVCVCAVNKSFFLSVADNNPHVARDIITLLATDLGGAEKRMLSLSYKSVRSRIAEALILLAENFGYRSDGQTIDVPVYRRDIAEFAGVTIETTIRNLNEMVRENTIGIRNRLITILDEKKLRETAQMK